MQISARVITEPGDIAEIEDELACFVNCHGENPFLLPSFLKSAMGLFPAPNQVPVVLVIKGGNEIIGFCPILLNQTIGGRHATPLLGIIAATSFILKDEHSLLAMEIMLSLLFKKLNCKSVHLWSYHQWKHCVIPVDCSWSDHQESLGTDFKRKIRKTSRKLDDLGRWELVSFEGFNPKNESVLCEKVFAVEKQSWKESHRKLVGATCDSSLTWVLETSPSPIEEAFGIKRWFLFLEVDHQPIAYQMGYEFHGTAFFTKTSFNEIYRKLGLGKFITTMAIKKVFESNSVKMIDFLANLPVYDFWEANCLERSKMTLNAQGMNRLFVNTKTLVGIAYRCVKREGNRPLYFKPTAMKQMEEAKKKQQDV